MHGNTDIVNVQINADIRIMGKGAFKNCSNLQTISLPNYLSEIKAETFSGCTNLSSVTLPTYATSIGDSAFARCQKLQNITIPSNVKTIGDSVFIACYSLNNVNIQSNLEKIPNSAFYACDLQNINIPSTVTEIGETAFAYNANLSSFTIPEKLTSIGFGAFINCTSLREILIPSTVTSIGNAAFYKVGETRPNDFKGPLDITIKCYKNSAAHNWAVKCNANYVLLDDNNEINYIKVTKLPNKTTYKKDSNETLDLTGGIITVYYTNGNTETVDMTNSEITTNNFSTALLGNKTIVVSYKQKNTTFNITILEKELVSMEIKKEPTKKEYIRGAEDLSLEGGELLLKYEDGSTEVKSMTFQDVTVSGFDSSKLGTNRITVKYRDKEVYFDVTVVPVIVTKIEVETKLTKNTYVQNSEQLDLSGGFLKITYSNSTTAMYSTESKKVTVTGFDNTKLGKNTITFSFGGQSVQYDVTIIPKEITNISINKLPDKTEYIINKEQLDLTGGKIDVQYNDGTTLNVDMTSDKVTVNGFDNTKKGKITINLIYEQKQTSFEVEIVEDSIISGDLNGNGKVDSTDLLLIKRHIIAGNKTEWILTGEKFKRADMNSDGIINATDLLLIKRKIING